jgi:two-component system phosphate regulon response regulator PhoB
LLEAGSDEQDLELPLPPGEFHDSDWVIASFTIGPEKTSIAACVVDRGNGLRLAFEDRDWQKLWHFADRSQLQVPRPTSVPPPPSAETVSAGGSHVLIVDDDPETQEVVQALLSSSGYLASAVSSAEAAFDTLTKIPIDLVLIEWKLPGMSGIEFCRRARKDRRLQSLPIIFLSTQSSTPNVTRAFETGADDYIAKPFRALELTARVMGLIRRSRMPAHGS